MDTRLSLAIMLLTTAIACGEEVELISGERLQGTIVERSEERIVLEHDLLGRLAIPISAVRSVEPPAGDGEAAPPAADASPPQPEPPADSAAAQAPPEPVVEPEPSPWKQQFEVGATLRDGNVQDQQARFAYKASRESPTNRFRCDASYRYATSRGDRTQNAFTSGLHSAWHREAGRLSTFVEARYDAAEFQAWDQRITSGGGLEYELIEVREPDESGAESEIFSVLLRGGSGLRKEIGSPKNEIDPEGVIGGELSWRITPAQTLEANSTYYPNISNADDFRIVSAVDWRLDLDTMDGVSVKVGLTHEHQSVTAPDVQHNDLSVFATLVFSF